MPSDWEISNLKLKFANIYLEKILSFDDQGIDYIRTAEIENYSGTTSISLGVNKLGDGTNTLTDAKKILEDINRFIDCYFIFIKISIDVLSEEIFKKLNLKCPIYKKSKKSRPINIFIFDDCYVKKQLISLQKLDILNRIKSFIDDDDIKITNKCRIEVVHKSIINESLLFKQEINNSKLELVRPIIMPDFIKNMFTAQGSKNLTLEDWLQIIYKKVEEFHTNIKSAII